MSEPAWIEAADVITLNELEAQGAGTTYGVRDLGLLESACNRPINLYIYEDVDDVVELAVCLMMAIARNHPFIDGNKRSGFEAARAFLAMNGYDLDIPDWLQIAELYVAVIERAADEDELVDTFHDYAIPLDTSC
jgi:death-on-curing protein